MQVTDTTKKQFYCYVLYDHRQKNTYCGYTNAPAKRIRQHNGLISGGAKATKGKGPWKYLAVVSSPTWVTASPAMSLEWHVKHPTGTRSAYYGVRGRLLSLSNAIPRDISLTLYIDKDYARKLPDFPDNVTISRDMNFD